MSERDGSDSETNYKALRGTTPIRTNETLGLKISGKLDIGAQAGFKVKVGALKVSAEVDAGSIEIASGSMDSSDGVQGDFFGKNDVHKHEMGVDVSAELISNEKTKTGIGAKIERNYSTLKGQRGIRPGTDKFTSKAEIKILGKGVRFGKQETKTGKHINTSAGIEFGGSAVIGVEVKIELIKRKNE